MSLLHVLLALAVAACVVLVQRYITRRKYDVWRLKGPRPSKAHWLWGHEKEVFDRECGDAFSQWTDEHGAVYKITGAFKHGDIVVTTDPSVLSHILSRHVYSYVKSPVFRPLIDRLLGKSMVWAEGEDHIRMKRTLGNSFAADKVREMESTVLDTAHKFATALRTHALEVTEQTGQNTATVDVLGWSSRATLDIIGRVGFGHDFGLGTSPEARAIMKLWREQVNLGLTSAGFIAPLVLRAFPFITSLPFKSIQAQGAIKAHIRELAQDLARKGKLTLTNRLDNDDINGRSQGQDLLSSLARASIKERSSRMGTGMDVDELLDHITTFVMVGHETTAGVLNYTFHALGNHPQYQEALRAELDAFGREPTYEDYTNPNTDGLDWLEAITKEAMRMFPPSAHTERVALEDDVIPLAKPIVANDGTVLTSVKIKKGQYIYIPSISINTCSSIWGPTGKTFDPTRWLPSSHPYFEKHPEAVHHSPPPKAVNGGWNSLMSFSEGPRLCLGYRLAVFEYKAILSEVIRGGVWFEGTGDRIQSKFSGTLQPYVVGKESLGSCLPVKVGIVKE